MTVQNEPSAKTHGVILTEAAAPRRSRCWTRRDGTIWRCGSRFSRGGALDCAITFSSTTGRWMVTKPRSSVVSG